MGNRMHLSQRVLRRIHQDTRGAIGILLLLVIVALVTLIAFVWNTGEFATRRQHVQNSADTAAYSTALWPARTTNLISGQNMLIAENASTEIVWRSVIPTYEYVDPVRRHGPDPYGRRYWRMTGIIPHLQWEVNQAQFYLQGRTWHKPEPGDLEYLEEALGIGDWSDANNPDFNLRPRTTKLINTLQGYSDSQGNHTGLKQDIDQLLLTVSPLLSANQKTQIDKLSDRIRRYTIALQWADNVWIRTSTTFPQDNRGYPTGQPQPPAFGAYQGLLVDGQALDAYYTSKNKTGWTGLAPQVGPWLETTAKPSLWCILQSIPYTSFNNNLAASPYPGYDVGDYERPYADQFRQQADPALQIANYDENTLHNMMVQRRTAIYDYQQQINALTPTAASEQNTKHQTFSKCDTTIGTPDPTNATGSVTPSGQPATVNAPIRLVNEVKAWETDNPMHVDSIRAQYPDAAFQEFGTTEATIKIDPLNCFLNYYQNNEDQDPRPNGQDGTPIWHPYLPGDYEPPVNLGTFNFTVGTRTFGHVYNAPMTRYLSSRLAQDRAGLQSILQKMDDVRAALKQELQGRGMWDSSQPPLPPSMPGYIADPNFNTPPGNPADLDAWLRTWIPLMPDQPPAWPDAYRYLTDSSGNVVKDAKGNPVPRPPHDPEPITTIPFPVNVDANTRARITAINARITQFNRDVRSLFNDINNRFYTMTQDWNAITSNNTVTEPVMRPTGSLVGWVSNVRNFCTYATDAYAVPCWFNHTEFYRRTVLRHLGQQKEYMVLKTYDLRNIPSWAISDMTQSAYQYVYDDTYNRNIGPIRSSYFLWLRQQYIRQGMPMGQAYQMASQTYWQYPIDPSVAQITDVIASETAAEWVSRPWPFEITPPEQKDVLGLTKSDRLSYFTLITGARTTPETGVVPMKSWKLTYPNPVMSSYAQAEVFNWYEGNNAWGAGDKYDELTFGAYGLRGASSPAPWRLCSQAGWAWQPRLSFSDALYPTLTNSPQFQEYLHSGGPTTDVESAVETLNQH